MACGLFHWLFLKFLVLKLGMFGYWIKSTYLLSIYWPSLDTLVTFLKFLVLKFCCLDVNLVHIATTSVGILCLYDKTLHSSCFPSREKTADFSYFKRLLRIAKQANDKYFWVKRQVAFEKKNWTLLIIVQWKAFT